LIVEVVLSVADEMNVVCSHCNCRLRLYICMYLLGGWHKWKENRKRKKSNLQFITSRQTLEHHLSTFQDLSL